MQPSLPLLRCFAWIAGVLGLPLLRWGYLLSIKQHALGGAESKGSDGEGTCSRADVHKFVAISTNRCCLLESFGKCVLSLPAYFYYFVSVCLIKLTPSKT